MNNELDRIIKVVGYSILIGFAIICICLLFTNNVEIATDNVVISFLGILATFVVIGNYSQVSHLMTENRRHHDEVEKRLKNWETEMQNTIEDFTQQINYVRGEIVYDNGNSKIQELLCFKTNIEKTFPDIKKQLLVDYQATIEEVIRSSSAQLLSAMIYLIQGEQKDLVNNVINHRQESRYTIQQQNVEEIKSGAIALWENDMLVFQDVQGNIIDNVSYVSGHPYDAEDVKSVLHTLFTYMNIEHSIDDSAMQSFKDCIFEE